MRAVVEVWWSHRAKCWRIEDGEMFSYFDLSHVIRYLRTHDRAALVQPPPHSRRTADLLYALNAARIPIEYAEDV